MIDPGLSGRVALVTGCNRAVGIGAAIARALAAQGVAVALAVGPAETPPGGAAVSAPSLDGRAVLTEIRRLGASAALFDVDLADPYACGELLGRVEKTFGPTEILVNNAAHSRPDTLLPIERSIFSRSTVPVTAAALDAHHAVNVRAPALLIADLYRRHVERGGTWGRVISISTDGAAVFPSEVSYGATKNGLESLSRSAAHELGPVGITVNILALGPIQTGSITDDMLPGIRRDTPLGRVGRPDDVADVVVFLASDQARWVTGQTIYVGGGHRMV
jgi:3-oxoacyl-[acyl-carrier protein] reductase